MIAKIRAMFTAWRARRRPATPYHSRHAVDEGLFTYMIEAPRLRRRLQQERLCRAIRAARAKNKIRRGARAQLARRAVSAIVARQAEPVRSPAREIARTSYQPDPRNPVSDTEEMLLMIGVILHQPVRRHYAPRSWGWDNHSEKVWATT